VVGQVRRLGLLPHPLRPDLHLVLSCVLEVCVGCRVRVYVWVCVCACVCVLCFGRGQNDK
jgi:hypothetical protein